MQNFPITKHFTYFEMTYTNMSYLLYQNRVEGLKYLDKLKMQAYYLLEPGRTRYGKPLIITSCFRCWSLNDLIKSTKTSQHPLGEATDFYIKDNPCSKVFDWYCISGIPFGQLIYEKKGYSEWIHISLPTLENNGQILIFENGQYRRLK